MAFAGTDPGVDKRQFDVVQSSRAREQVEGLKDEADLFVADAREFVVVHVGDELAVDPVAPFARRVEAADQIHQG